MKLITGSGGRLKDFMMVYWDPSASLHVQPWNRMKCIWLKNIPLATIKPFPLLQLVTTVHDTGCIFTSHFKVVNFIVSVHSVSWCFKPGQATHVLCPIWLRKTDLLLKELLRTALFLFLTCSHGFHLPSPMFGWLQNLSGQRPSAWHHVVWVEEDIRHIYTVSSVQFSHVRLFATPWITACQAYLSIINSQSSLKLVSIQSMMPSSHLILCCPLLLLPPISTSIRLFSNESTLRIRWPKYWSFSFSIIPSKEIPGLISFRMEWLDLLAVQGTLKSLLQHHSSKASILRCQPSSQSNSHIHTWPLEKP